MKFTGEFFIPYDAEEENTDNPELEIEHKQRYLSILKMVEGKTVLDIASGEGYGTSILSSRARQTFGVDINPDLVEHAGRKYNQENIRFLHGSVDRIPLESNTIDVIVSFETLEHVDADTQKQFLGEVKRVLRTNGVFVVSTPNKKNYTDRYDHQNKFHLCELYKDRFEEILKEHFGHVRLYDQGQEVTSVILNKEDYLSQKPVTVVPVNSAYHFEGKYLIGLCSDQPETIQASIASIVPESEKSYFQLVDRILELQQEVEKLGAWGTRSAGELETLSKERAATMESLEEARRNINLYKDMSGKLQEDLARSNNNAFLLEAELEVIQKNNAQKNGYSLDMDSFTQEVVRLSEVISGKVIRHTPLTVPEKGKKPLTEISSIQNLEQQLAQLQKDVLWYKKTYEERSLLGVIKQKIAAKFRK